MTDKEYRQQKKRVLAIINKWRSIIGISGDRLRFDWHRLCDPESPEAVASVNASWEYRNHKINLYLPVILGIDDEEELEGAILHELCHILLHPATGNSTGKSDAEIEKIEYVVTSVAYALMWVEEAGKRGKSGR